MKSLVLQIGASAALSAAVALVTVGVRLGEWQQRVQMVEQEQTLVRAQHDQLRREVIERLTRIELGLVELRAEQRILHGR